MTEIKSISCEFSYDETVYLLNALEEFKNFRKKQVEQDENGELDITPMYADDILLARLIYEKISVIALQEFGENVTAPLSYDTL